MLSGLTLDVSTDGLQLPYLTFNAALNLTSINRLGKQIFGENQLIGKNIRFFLCKGSGNDSNNLNQFNEEDDKETLELVKRIKKLANSNDEQGLAWADSIVLEFWTSNDNGLTTMERNKSEAILTCYPVLPKSELPPSPPYTATTFSPSSNGTTATSSEEEFKNNNCNFDTPCSFSILFTKRIPLPISTPLHPSIDFRSLIPGATSARALITDPIIYPVGEEIYDLSAGFDPQREITSLIDKANDLPLINVDQQMESYYKNMIDNLPQIVFTADPAGIINYFNKQWYTFTGLTHEETTEIATLLKCFSPEDMKLSVNHWMRSITTGCDFNVEYRVKSASGEYQWCVAKGKPIKDSRGVITAWITTITPVEDLIRARSEALRTQELVAAVLHGAGIVLLSVDTNSIVTSCEYSNLRKSGLGTASNDLPPVGQPLSVIWPDEKVLIGVKNILEEGLEALTWLTEAEDAVDDQFFQYRLIPLRSASGPGSSPEELTGVIMVASDVSKIVAANDNLRKLELEKTLLIASEHAAKEASRLKTEFVENMSHEIRTPIATMIGICEILIDDPTLSDSHKDLVQKSLRSGEILLDLVGMVLDMGKVEAGKLVLEETPFLLKETIADSALFSVNAQKNGVEFIEVIEDYFEGMLEGDRFRLRQVMANGLSNAVKFTKTGSITLKVRQESESATGVVIIFQIQDTGIGIDESVLPTLFTPFQQADTSTARNYGGTGLGLVIARNLIELMGGTILLESTAGVGTCMTIRVPLAKATTTITSSPNLESLSYNNGNHHTNGNENYINGSSSIENDEEKDQEELDARNPEDIHILLAEDNGMIREIVIRTLKKMNFQITGVNDGAAAVQAVKDGHFDLILLDGQMPILDGYEATKMIRQLDDPIKRNIKIIALTASAFKGDRERCMLSGMDSYLAKPVRSKDLEAEIWKQLKTRKSLI